MRNSQDIPGSNQEEVFEPASSMLAKGLKNILGGIVIVTLAINLIAVLIPKPEPVERKYYNWNGYDPNRPITEMSELDYSTHTIKYIDKGPRKHSPATQQYRDNYQGISIKVDGKWVNLENVDHYDIIDKLNIEWEDLYEYLMD